MRNDLLARWLGRITYRSNAGGRGVHPLGVRGGLPVPVPLPSPAGGEAAYLPRCPAPPQARAYPPEGAGVPQPAYPGACLSAQG